MYQPVIFDMSRISKITFYVLFHIFIICKNQDRVGSEEGKVGEENYVNGQALLQEC